VVAVGTARAEEDALGSLWSDARERQAPESLPLPVRSDEDATFSAEEPERPEARAPRRTPRRHVRPARAVPRRPASHPAPAAAVPPPALAPPAGEPTEAAAVPRPIAMVNGVPFVWPALDGAAYAEPGAEPFRRVIARWQSGAAPAGPPPKLPASAAELYLAADLTFLRATAGRTDLFAALTAYERALREAPDFADAARAGFVLGQVQLALGLAPEAGAAFTQLERRFPASPLVPYARLGQAAALRLRRRPLEARRLLDEVLAKATGDVLCRARIEEAAEVRAADTPAAAAEAFRRLATTCPEALAVPGVLGDHVEALIAAGDRDEARRLLAAPHEPGSPDEEGRLHLLAGTLAADAGDAEGARAECERVLGTRTSSALVLEAKMRLALLDAAGRPEQAAAALAALPELPAPRALRAAVFGEAADATARAGKFDRALVLLDRAAALGREGEAQADGRRAELLGRWIAALDAKGDAAGVATVYAAYTTYIEELAVPEDRLAVATALGRIGLHAAAVRLLEQGVQSSPRQPSSASSDIRSAFAAALAEEALAAGDLETARATAARLLTDPLPAELAKRVRRTAARAALQAGDSEAAAAEAAQTEDAEVRAEVAAALLPLPGGPSRAQALVEPALASAEAPVRALLVAGAAAAAEGAWDRAADAYARALARGATGPERLQATAGLAHAAGARGDSAAAAAAFAQLGGAAAELGGKLGEDLGKNPIWRGAAATDRSRSR